MKGLQGRTAIVTGAGRGIGRAVAELLARDGANVVVNDLGGSLGGEGSSSAVAAEAAARITSAGGVAVPNFEDVSDFEGARRLVQAALDEFGQLDILVNNAGITRRTWLHHMTEHDWEQVYRVNLKGTFNCIRHACIPMRERGYGRIVNISSTAGVIRGGAVGGRRVAYGATKGGIYGLTNLAYPELGAAGVTVNTVLPGGSRTRMSEAAISEHDEAMAGGDALTQALEGMIADLELTPPEDLAPLVTYLCTEQAGYVTGHVFFGLGNSYGWCKPMEVTRRISKERRWTVEELIDLMPRTLAADVAEKNGES